MTVWTLLSSDRANVVALVLNYSDAPYIFKADSYFCLTEPVVAVEGPESVGTSHGKVDGTPGRNSSESTGTEGRNSAQIGEFTHAGIDRNSAGTLSESAGNDPKLK